MNAANSQPNGNEQYIYCKYIVKNGKRIYPKNGSVFKIPLSSLKKRKSN